MITITGLTRTFKTQKSVSKYSCVRLGAGTNQIAENTGATTVNMGLTLESASATSSVAVAMTGTAKGVALRDITKGAYLAAGTGGYVATSTNAADSIIGIAITSASASDVIEVLLCPGTRY